MAENVFCSQERKSLQTTCRADYHIMIQYTTTTLLYYTLLCKNSLFMNVSFFSIVERVAFLLSWLRETKQTACGGFWVTTFKNEKFEEQHSSKLFFLEENISMSPQNVVILDRFQLSLMYLLVGNVTTSNWIFSQKN